MLDSVPVEAAFWNRDLRPRQANTVPEGGRLRDAIARGLSGRARILVVHNIRDGQGDEIVRCMPLLQSLVDANPALTVTMLTQRAYLYSHPRIACAPVGGASLDSLLGERFDGVIDFFDPQISEVNYDQALEPASWTTCAAGGRFCSSARQKATTASCISEWK